MSQPPPPDPARPIASGRAADTAGAGLRAWAQLLQAARITVAEQDLELRYLAVMEQPDGPDLSGIIGLRDSDIYDPALAARLESIKRGAIEGGRPRQGRVDLTHADQRRTYELTATPRRNADGAITGVLSIAVDVTHVLQAPAPSRTAPAQGSSSAVLDAAPEGDARLSTLSIRDRTEHDRWQAQWLQSQKLDAVSRLAGGVAHDFNNVLTVILGYCELLRRRQRASTELDEISSAARRASQLTRQLLAFGRRQVLQVEAVDLNGLIRGLQRLLRRSVGDDIVVTTTLADEALWVVVDAGQMEQVLVNLADNAREAMPSGGTLHITTRIVDAERVAAAGSARDRVELTVHDSGTGMTDDVRARLFEPFFTTRGGTATGLGLAVVHGIVVQSGGRIDCESAPGEGATFRISLPLALPPAEPSPAALPSGAAVGGDETVLLVEHEAQVRELSARALREYGYAVLEAHDVPSALHHVEHPRLAIVVADASMPGTHGGDLATELGCRNPPLPVLLMTSHAEALQHPVDPARLLRKPFTPADLAARIRGLLDRPPAPHA